MVSLPDLLLMLSRYYEPTDEHPEHYMDRCLCGHCGTDDYYHSLDLLDDA